MEYQRDAAGRWTLRQRESLEGKLKGNDVYLPHSYMVHRPRAKFSSTLIAQERRRVVFEADDEIDGLHCHRVSIETIRADGAVANRRVVWICPDRNYLPIRTELFSLDRNATLPASVVYVDEIREVRPDTWFPIRWTHLACNAIAPMGLVEDRMIVNWGEDTVVTDVNLKPDIRRVRGDGTDLGPTQ